MSRLRNLIVRKRRIYPPATSGAASNTFSGSISLAETFSGIAFTLLVDDPDYDTFVETSDPDNKATLNGDEVSVSGLDYETKTSHSLSYTADVSNGSGKPQKTLNVTILVTNVFESTFYILGF